MHHVHPRSFILCHLVRDLRTFVAAFVEPTMVTLRGRYAG